VQDTVFEARRDLIGRDSAREAERALECAVTPLPYVEAPFAFLFAGLHFPPADGENIVLDLEFDVLLAKARKLRRKQELLGSLLDVDRGKPGGPVRFAERAPREYTVQAVGHLVEVTPRGKPVAVSIAGDGHGWILLPFTCSSEVAHCADHGNEAGAARALEATTTSCRRHAEPDLT
jgi:hypothetical protein